MEMHIIDFEEFPEDEQKYCFDKLSKGVEGWEKSLPTIKDTLRIASPEVAAMNLLRSYLAKEVPLNQKLINFIIVCYNAYLYIAREMKQEAEKIRQN